MLRKSPLGHLQLAKQHGAGLTQTGDDGSVPSGSVVLMNRHAGRSRNSLGVAKILHRNGNPVQGAANGAATDFGVSLLGLSQGQIGSEGCVALQATVEPRDPVKDSLRDFNRRHALGLNPAPNLDEIGIAQIVSSHRCSCRQGVSRE